MGTDVGRQTATGSGVTGQEPTGQDPVGRDQAGGSRKLAERLERAEALDAVAGPLRRVARAVLRPQALRDLLHGVWLGHPLHPALVSLPVGALLSAAVLDAVPGQERAAELLIGTGIATAVPSAVSGLNDWSSMAREQRRVGVVHAAANVVALGLYAGSLAARARGRYRLGRTLAYAGLGAGGLGAYLGGELSFRQAAGVSHAAPELRRVPEGWQDVAALSDVPDGGMVTRQLGEVPVLVYRDGSRVTVMIARCGHHAGPLGEGEITEVDGAACVVCPWHGSTFRLADGTVVHGPAASGQPTLRTRVVAGRIEASLP